MHKPWFHLRLGQTVFYLARPMSMGLTIFRRRLFERQPVEEFLFTLGGPTASLLGLIGGVLAWWMGMRSDLLAAWIAISALICITSAVPFSMRQGRLQIDNDARLLIDLAKYGRQAKPQPLGLGLANLRAMGDLLAQIGRTAAASYFRIGSASVEAQLGDFTAARESLAVGEAYIGADAIDTAPALASFARAVIAVEENADDAEQLLETAAELCRIDATGEFTVACLRERWRLGRGIDIRARGNELRERAIAATRNDWLTTVEVLLFEADPSDNTDVQYRELLARHPRYLSNVRKARLLALATERLAACGAHDRARIFFADAQRAIVDAAATIACPTTREKYLRRVAAPLQRAVVATRDEVPLFVGDTPAEKPAKGDQFARATFTWGVATLLCAFCWTVSKLGAKGAPSSQAAEIWLGMSYLCFALAIICGLTSLSNSERRYRRLAFGLLLATLGLAWPFMAGKKQPRESRFKPAPIEIDECDMQ